MSQPTITLSSNRNYDPEVFVYGADHQRLVVWYPRSHRARRLYWSRVSDSAKRLRDVRLCLSLDVLDVRKARARQIAPFYGDNLDSCSRRVYLLRRTTSALLDGMAGASWVNLRGRSPSLTSSSDWVLDNAHPNHRPSVSRQARRLFDVTARLFRYAGVRSMFRRATEYRRFRPFVRTSARALRSRLDTFGVCSPITLTTVI